MTPEEIAAARAAGARARSELAERLADRTLWTPDEWLRVMAMADTGARADLFISRDDRNWLLPVLRSMVPPHPAINVPNLQVNVIALINRLEAGAA